VCASRCPISEPLAGERPDGALGENETPSSHCRAIVGNLWHRTLGHATRSSARPLASTRRSRVATVTWGPHRAGLRRPRRRYGHMKALPACRDGPSMVRLMEPPVPMHPRIGSAGSPRRPRMHSLRTARKRRSSWDSCAPLHARGPNEERQLHGIEVHQGGSTLTFEYPVGRGDVQAVPTVDGCVIMPSVGEPS